MPLRGSNAQTLQHYKVCGQKDKIPISFKALILLAFPIPKILRFFKKPY
jgi:hypothetical protein